MHATELDRIVASALAEFAQCGDPASLENAKARYLGKSGALTEQLKGLAKLSPAERPAAGATINEAKAKLDAAAKCDPQRASLLPALVRFEAGQYRIRTAPWKGSSDLVGLSRAKRSRTQLILGPWTHGDRSLSHAGDVEFGPAAPVDGNLAEDVFQNT